MTTIYLHFASEIMLMWHSANVITPTVRNIFRMNNFEPGSDIRSSKHSWKFWKNSGGQFYSKRLELKSSQIVMKVSWQYDRNGQGHIQCCTKTITYKNTDLKVVMIWDKYINRIFWEKTSDRNLMFMLFFRKAGFWGVMIY